MPKISDRMDKFVFSFSDLFWGPLFIRTVYMDCIQHSKYAAQMYLNTRQLKISKLVAVTVYAYRVCRIR